MNSLAAHSRQNSAVDQTAPGGPTLLTINVHATVVQWLGRGLLIQGQSGAGKSDLAIQLIDAGASLVADDLVVVSCQDQTLSATSLTSGQGLIELRGQGLYRLPFTKRVSLDLAILLLKAEQLVRLPEPATLELCGQKLPQLTLQTGAASNVARLRIALNANRWDEHGR